MMRAQLVEAMAQAMYEAWMQPENDPWPATAERDDWLLLASAGLARALAWRPPCPECVGNGHTADQDYRDHPDPCSACGGSGVADSPRLALVEQVGHGTQTNPRARSHSGWTFSDGLSEWGHGEGAVPVFVELVSDQGVTEVGPCMKHVHGSSCVLRGPHDTHRDVYGSQWTYTAVSDQGGTE